MRNEEWGNKNWQLKGDPPHMGALCMVDFNIWNVTYIQVLYIYKLKHTMKHLFAQTCEIWDINMLSNIMIHIRFWYTL